MNILHRLTKLVELIDSNTRSVGSSVMDNDQYDYDLGCISTILDQRLYLGSCEAATNVNVLRQNKITHIVNCTDCIFEPKEKWTSTKHAHNPSTPHLEISYLYLPMADVSNEPISWYFEPAIKFISTVLNANENNRILIHCRQGVSRSATITIAYVMYANSWRLDHALQYVQKQRSVVDPNEGFMVHLKEFEKRLFNSNYNKDFTGMNFVSAKYDYDEYNIKQVVELFAKHKGMYPPQVIVLDMRDEIEFNKCHFNPKECNSFVLNVPKDGVKSFDIIGNKLTDVNYFKKSLTNCQAIDDIIETMMEFKFYPSKIANSKGETRISIIKNDDTMARLNDNDKYYATIAAQNEIKTHVFDVEEKTATNADAQTPLILLLIDTEKGNKYEKHMKKCMEYILINSSLQTPKFSEIRVNFVDVLRQYSHLCVT